MKRKFVLVFLLIVMIMVPVTMVEASDESSQLEILSLETNNKQLSEGDTFVLQADISGDISKVDKLIVKYRLKDTDKVKELELNYNDKNELWELNFQINEDWEEGLWEIYEVSYFFKEDANYKTLEWQECYTNGKFTVNKVKDKKITDQSINIVNKEKSKEVKLANVNTTGDYVKEVDWTSDKRSPQDLGSSIKITANAKGSDNVLYCFQIRKDGVWTTL
ncbi:MAG TPA: hypothetical protein GXX63_05290, partial [Tissierellia bacterium]|nr:hypothetical protein [Tissierellia bacterium]